MPCPDPYPKVGKLWQKTHDCGFARGTSSVRNGLMVHYGRDWTSAAELTVLYLHKGVDLIFKFREVAGLVQL